MDWKLVTKDLEKWFQRKAQQEPPDHQSSTTLYKCASSEGSVHCPHCQTSLSISHQKICERCGYHAPLSAMERLQALLDPGSFQEKHASWTTPDPLEMTLTTETYRDQSSRERITTGLNEALIIGRGTIEQMPVAIAVADLTFFQATMGSIFGEKLVRLIECAIEHSLPVITISCSRGFRIHEGVFSLIQTANVVIALRQLAQAKLPHISLLTHPCYGGVTASYALTADIVLAEPGASIGFVNPTVIRNVEQRQVPEDFQAAEALLQRGFIDAIVPRQRLHQTLSYLLSYYHCSRQQGMERASSMPPFYRSMPVSRPLPVQNSKVHEHMTAWQKVKTARHPQRPHALDYINSLCSSFLELHGDRTAYDDEAIIGGLGTFEGRSVVVVGHQKGADQQEQERRRYGMPGAEGYRKATRLMRHAEKFHLPLLCIIDTPGAYPGKESEERGLSSALAECIMTMAGLQTPCLALIIGEGGGIGALALGIADRLLMLEYAIYTVASPEAGALHLWQQPQRTSQAAEVLKLCAEDVLRFGLIDEVIPEPSTGAHTNYQATFKAVHDVLAQHLASLEHDVTGPTDHFSALLSQRHARFQQCRQRLDA